MNLKIGVIKGDGIGPEIVTEAMKVLDKTAAVYGHTIQYEQLLLGGASIDVHGVPLTEDTIARAKACDAVLMGSIGGDAKTSPWYKLEPDKRPEAGLLKIRKALNLFANLRPAVLYEELKGACPLKEEITEGGFDMMIMRELTGGLYFGERKTVEEGGVRTAYDSLTYNENEIRRIAKRAFDIAMKRRRKVTSVDKANVLDSSRLWRSVVEEVAKDYPDVTVENMLVDNCAMQLVKDPKQFDVILTENMFGDILSDEASMVTGSIGMLASASLNETKFGLYEPSGGSAPDIAGKGIANPIATILSAAMMLRFSFDLDAEADAIEKAVADVLKEGWRTIDIMSAGKKQVGTSEMGDLISARI
ncbi:3-isopropylmalate dehydrogenase [Mordavella massiliensis]|uniref:3-isopropylmalate dehydrogenase n=1 Tax=Mordavella massiliensis TaxID=1871024 RepID=A0A938XDK4_9CLOT|nr:3-isopropylmalate dehydrogenase [Mordavella massiliensis]MBM6948890.1 3-isopropylmalate dehydrogenase [Mordavella massiliensis]